MIYLKLHTSPMHPSNEALQDKRKNRKEGQARPGGANASFEVREFKASNGQI